jgi:hypothetical protein
MNETVSQVEAEEQEQERPVYPPRDRRYPPRRSRSKQISFGLPFEGPRRLRQVSFGLGLPFGDAQEASSQVPGTSSANNGEPSFLDEAGDETFNDNEAPGDVDGDGKELDHCQQNNRWGRGIVADFQRTILTHWKKEMSNLNQTVIATTFFLFFACIAPAITFGAIYAKATGNWIGAVEMITATAWCGIFYALVGGQPMVSCSIVSPPHPYLLHLSLVSPPTFIYINTFLVFASTIFR